MSSGGFWIENCVRVRHLLIACVNEGVCSTSYTFSMRDKSCCFSRGERLDI